MKNNLFDERFDPNDTLNFLKFERGGAAKRDSNKRRFDFKEVYKQAADEDQQHQAARCLDCGNPYCEWKCPLHNYIPNWLELVKKGQFQSAAELMHSSNPLPEICGRVCPQDRLCEQACTLNTGFGAVTIGAIEKNISDMALANNWRPDLSQVVDSGKTVAIVGAGPAGLGCAELLARNGIKPVVYDRRPEIGGLLTFGIPEFKLEKDIIRKRRKFLEDIGVSFHLNTEIGSAAGISIETIQAEYDAVFLGMGSYTPNDGNLAGREAAGVLKALDYLIGNVNQHQAYQMAEYPYHDLKGQRVLVLGGGDTAMDCVRSAVRQQARSVQCIYRKDETAMPGSRKEVQNAREEGVEFTFHLQPQAIKSDNGKVQGVEFTATNTDSEDTIFIQADSVIIAFGFKASPADWFNPLGIKLDQWGRVQTRKTRNPGLAYSQQTDVEGIYAGGDMVRGADLVVTAIAEGRQAALEIMQQLGL